MNQKLAFSEMNKHLSLRAKVTAFATLIALTCTLSTLAISYIKSRNALSETAGNQVRAVGTSAFKRVSSYFEKTRSFTISLAENRLTEGLFLAYESAFYAAGYKMGQDEKLTAKAFIDLDRNYKPKTEPALSSYDLANFFLVNMGGQVVFSAQPDSYGHFSGLSLTQGALKDSKLTQCFKNALAGKSGEAQFADYEHIAQLDRVASFMCAKAVAEFDHASEGIKKGDVLGVVVTEISLPIINDMLLARDGMGETGHIYLIAEDHILRSDMIIERETNNVNLTHKNAKKYESESIKRSLAGQSGLDVITGPLGSDVMSAYAPIEVMGHKWGIISEKRMAEILEPVTGLLYFVLGAGAVLFVLVIALAITVTSALVRPITLASETLQSVSEALTGGARELTHSAENLSSSARGQASNLQTTLSAVSQVSTTIEQNSQNARSSQEVSRVSLEAANRGRTVVNDMISSMGEIDQSTQQISQQLETTNSRLLEVTSLIKDIGEKTKVINDIVFQTRLLSFNASVEAARAGEHGKGFAVVAEEVGNLAQMSGNAAKEISTMLSDSIQRVEEMISESRGNIERFSKIGRDKVQGGTVTAQRCSQVLEEIVTNVQRVAEMVSSISQASAEQSMAMTEISKAMNQLNEGTDNTAKISVSSADAAERLEGQSDTLKEVVDTLVRTLQGAA